MGPFGGPQAGFLGEDGSMLCVQQRFTRAVNGQSEFCCATLLLGKEKVQAVRIWDLGFRGLKGLGFGI